MGLEFRILGPFEIRIDDRPVDIGRGKQRALLALLLLHAPEPVSTDRLIDELWPQGPPPTVAKSLQVYVSQLRKALGPNLLVTRGGGYALVLEGSELDAARFEQGLEEGRDLLRAGDPRRASETLGEALSRWRGAPLDDFAYEGFARGEIERLEELRLSALEERFEADLALGESAALVPGLEALVREHPLRERVTGQLMLALYRAGRQAEALAAYRRTHSALRDELGLEPGAELRGLEQAILRQDEAVSGTRSPQRSAVAPRFGRRAAIALGGALLLAAASTAAIVQQRSGEEGLSALAVDSVGQIDPDTGRIEAQLSVGRAPGALAVGEGAVWITNRSEQSISRIDTDSREVRTIPVSGHPSDIAVGGGAVWVVHVPVPESSGTTVSRVDPEAVLELRTIRLPGEFAESQRNPITYGSDSVWVGSPVERTTVAQLDPVRNALARETEVGPARGIASGYGALWVTTTAGVARIDPRTGTATSAIDLARIPEPTGVATGEDAVWISAASPCCARERRGAGILWRVDPARNEVTASATIAPELVGDVAVGEGAVWVADPRRRVVLRVDPQTLRVTKTIRIGNRPAGIAVGAGSVWVSVN